MNINQFRYLIALGLHPSLNAAAEYIHITPQSLGAAIKALENELGITLLERSPKGSILTSQAVELIRIAKPFINSLDQFILHSQAANGKISIAACYDSFYGYLPYVLQDLYQIAPQLKIYVKHMTAEEVVTNLENGLADVGFIFQTFYENTPLFDIPDDYTVFPIIDYQLVCQATGKYPITRHKTVTFAELSAYPLIVPIMFNDLNASLYDLIKYYTHAADLRVEYSIPVYRTMVRSGLGIGFSIKHRYEEQISTNIPDMPSIAISENIAIQLFCIYSNAATKASAVEYFIDYLKSCTQL